MVQIGFVVVAAEIEPEEVGMCDRGADDARPDDHRARGKRTTDCRATDPPPVQS
jgi:hypothetical protein